MVSIQESRVKGIEDGRAAMRDGKHELALELLLQAVSLCGRGTPREQEFLAHALTAEVLRHFLRWQEAADHLVVAERLARQLRHAEWFAKVRVTRVLVDYNLGISEDALVAFAGRALQAAEKAADDAEPHDAALGFYVAGQCALDLGDRGQARAHLQRAAQELLDMKQQTGGAGTILLVARALSKAGDEGSALDCARLARESLMPGDIASLLEVHRVEHALASSVGRELPLWPRDIDESVPAVSELSRVQLCHLHQVMAVSDVLRGDRTRALANVRRVIDFRRTDADAHTDSCFVEFESMVTSLVLTGKARLGVRVAAALFTFDPGEDAGVPVSRAYTIARSGALRTAEQLVREELTTLTGDSRVYAHLVLGEILERRAKRTIGRRRRKAILLDAFQLTAIARIARESNRFLLTSHALRGSHDTGRTQSARLQQFRLLRLLGDPRQTAATIAASRQSSPGRLESTPRLEPHRAVVTGPSRSPAANTLTASAAVGALEPREFVHVSPNPIVRLPDGALAMIEFPGLAAREYGIPFSELRSPVVVDLA